MDEEPVIERFKKGIEKFNAGSFYDCHDILEDVWFDVRGPSRRFYQGLIHLAVGFYHILERENPKGTISQLTKGIEKLTDFKPQFQGVELELLLTDIKLCIDEVEMLGKDKIQEFDSAMIPKIKFNPALFVEP